jgi:acyl-CoA synthetase (AMP-forming)/AMP-acid ligase II
MNMPERIQLSELLASFGREADAAVAHSATGPVSRSEFLRQARAWRQAFAAAPGLRFALHLDDSAEFAAALFGAWHAGKTVFLPADTLPATMRSLDSQVDGLAGNFPGALKASAATNVESIDWQSLDFDSTQLVLYTSGSSGDPVAISKTLRQLDNEVASLESRFGGGLGRALVQGTVSHQHIYGLLFRLLWPLSAGRPFAAQRLGYPEQIASAIGGQAAILIASPALLKRIPDSVDWSALRPALRAVFCSGGPLSAEAADGVLRLWDKPVIEVFGSTETGGIASRERNDAAWRVLPGVEFRIEQGQLHVRSAHLPHLQWHETQDLAFEAGEGFELRGRADRLVKLEERRISLTAIERALQAEAWVDTSRVLMLPGSRSRIAAVVVLTQAGRELLATEGRKAFTERLRAALQGQVDAIAVPRQWRFVEAMPDNSQGKTTEAQLAGLFQSARPAPRWLERGSQKASLALIADSDLAVFDGHFPQAPILPGVALVDWAIRWGRDAFAIDLAFLRMEAMKFQRMVTPGTVLDLSMNWHAENATLSFRFESVQGPHASGRILFAPPERSS